MYKIFINKDIMRKDILEKKEEILSMVNNHESKASICKFLKCKPETLDSYLKKFGITYEGNKGLKNKKIATNRISVHDYIKKDVVVCSKLRKLLIRDGIKEKKCEMCGISEWLGSELPLELHHIDGNRFNNEFYNLQILCPNCHAFTPTHRGKNLLSALSEKRDVEYRKFREALTDNADGNPEPSLSNKEGAETRHGTPKE
jgi:hypothetical protein